MMIYWEHAFLIDSETRLVHTRTTPWRKSADGRECIRLVTIGDRPLSLHGPRIEPIASSVEMEKSNICLTVSVCKGRSTECCEEALGKAKMEKMMTSQRCELRFLFFFFLARLDWHERWMIEEIQHPCQGNENPSTWFVLSLLLSIVCVHGLVLQSKVVFISQNDATTK